MERTPAVVVGVSFNQSRRKGHAWDRCDAVVFIFFIDG
jgi:hypothetical protein